MLRTSTIFAAASLLAAAAHAQCYTTPAVGPITLASWSSTNGFAATNPVDDEGLTPTPIDITPAFGPGGFPMPGAVGTLDRMWINTNGEVYLTDSTAALTQPAGGALFGVNTLDEARGPAGGSPRIFPLGGDHEASVVAGAAWAITCQVTPGQVKVSWTDMTRFANTTDRFSFACTLLASGVVVFEYGNTFPVMSATRFVGISIGNAVGSASSPSRNLTAPGGIANSGTEGLLYESFATTGAFDLNDKTLQISPNGIGGYVAIQTCGGIEPAANFAYGSGCHAFIGADTDDVFQLFADHASAKAALDGNALQFTRTPTGYVVNWLPGTAAALYLAPSVGATITANLSTGVESFSPSAPIPVPGGVAATWTLSSEGILTAAATGNQGTDTTPALLDTVAATGLAFYTWLSQSPTEAGSGKFKREEVGGVLYVTAEGVEATGTPPTVAPSTYQWQINMATGDVTMLWPAMTVSTSTGDVLVGCTLAGTGIVTPVSQSLAALSAAVMSPQQSLTAMTLAAAPAPVINPSTNVTFTAANLPEFVPGSGVYISTLFLSVAPLPGGFPLTGLLTTVPGCNAYVATLDVDLGGQLTLAPTATWSLVFNNVVFAPGNVIGAQAVSLFNTAFPLVNGEAGGFLLSNGVATYTQTF
ncbi:MAG: hypothetical protein JNL08_08360 [Planctomycetes bacterium]|nr:hypothetical protein [Planctomycetota bacterium]